MRNHFFLVVLAVVPSALAHAQSWQGYLFGGPSQIRALGMGANGIQFGGGGKYVAGNRLGYGAELGAAGPVEDFKREAFAIASVNGYYHIKTGDANLDVFVTGGYSRCFGNDCDFNFGNIGAGVSVWVWKKTGLLLELRDHIHRVGASGVTLHVWGVRFGLAFRSGRQ